ncbi:MAG: hypothetical protein AAGG69_08145 [Pseudomonadota bacterium]
MKYTAILAPLAISTTILLAACSQEDETSASAPSASETASSTSVTDENGTAGVTASNDVASANDGTTAQITPAETALQLIGTIAAGGSVEEVASMFVESVDRERDVVNVVNELATGDAVTDVDRALVAKISEANYEKFDSAASAVRWASVLVRGVGVDAQPEMAMELLSRPDVVDLPQAKHFTAMAKISMGEYDEDEVTALLQAASEGGVRAADRLLEQIQSQ